MSHPNVIFNDAMVDLLGKSQYFKIFTRRRMSCEKWVQAEVLLRLDKLEERGAIAGYEAEKQYPAGKGERCDMYFETGGSGHWVELQAVVTNYCGISGINITDRIKHVKEDVERLRGFVKSPDRRYVLFPAYPFSADGSDDASWKAHHLGTLMALNLANMRMWEFNIELNAVGRFYLLEL